MSESVQLSESDKQGVRALRRAVRKEVEKKSKLGQYVIILHEGRTVRMPASEALKLMLPLEDWEKETASPKN